ncbi:hypothetical protein [Providencia manganoxydans]|uniref:hypothetical protein n=1 Tax=Providencia manganoxydans TaxID=2923283 RepID=UPI0034E550A6
MKLSTQRIICFLAGVMVTCIFFYLKNDRKQEDIEIAKSACFFVWEEHHRPAILSYAGRWDNAEFECLVFDNGGFRKLNDDELNSYQASWETDIR